MPRVARCRLTPVGVETLRSKFRAGRWANVAAFCGAAGVPRATYYELVGQKVLFEEATIQDKLTSFGMAEQSGLYEYVEHDPGPRSARSATHNNLPSQPTSFIGRDAEKATVKRLLAGAPMLTLTGAGGCGKTRLALQVASEVFEEYPDGVFVLELASITDPDLVHQALLSALGLREELGRPSIETITAYLKPKTVLLVLDNCEHLIVGCAQLAAALISDCPKVKILATSREPCRVDGETVWRVPSMPLPEPVLMHASEAEFVNTLAGCDAVRLFVERARAVRAGFVFTTRNAPHIAEICRRLDGIPLAIELAAAHVRSMAVEDINRRLDRRFGLLTGNTLSAPPRHQTLATLIDWSYDLLNACEKALLNRLSVFRGGCNLEAVEQVCVGGGVELSEVWNALTSLIDKSLVAFDERDERARYRLLETIRIYAASALQASGESSTMQDNHLGYFLELAVDAGSQPECASQIGNLDGVEREHDNLRAAFAWSLDNDDQCGTTTDKGQPSPYAPMRLCWGLRRFWLRRGYLAEGREWCVKALACKGAGEPTLERARTLLVLGVMACNQCDFVLAVTCHDESLAIFREVGDQWGVAAALDNLGVDAASQGNYSDALANYGKGLAIRRDTKDKLGAAMSLHNIGNAYRVLGEPESAHESLAESLSIYRDLQHSWGIPATLSGLGNLAEVQNDLAAARSFYLESLPLFQKIGDRQTTACVLEALAGVMSSEEQMELTVLLWGAAEALRAQIGAPMLARERGEYNRAVADARSTLGEPAFSAARAAGRAMTLEQAIELALERS